MSELLNSSNSAQDLPISDMDAATDQSIAAAGTSDFVGGYNITSNVKTNKRFSFAAIANFVLSKFKPSALSGIGDGSATGAITTLNSKWTVRRTGNVTVDIIDTYTSTGIYECYIVSPLPGGSAWGTLIVHKLTTETAEQIIVTNQGIGVRHYEGGAWGNWVKMPTRAEVGTADISSIGDGSIKGAISYLASQI